MEIKPLGIDYNLGAINGFDRVNIAVKNGKYLIGYCKSKELQSDTMIEIKDAIIGGFGFLANEKFINDNFAFYDTYEECVDIIKKRNPKNLFKDFENHNFENHNFLIAIKPTEKF